MDWLIKLACVFLLSVSTEAAKGKEDGIGVVSDNGHDLSDRALIEQLLYRVAVLETNDRNQQHQLFDQKKVIDEMKTELSGQIKLRSDMKSEMSTLKQQMKVMTATIKRLRQQNKWALHSAKMQSVGGATKTQDKKTVEDQTNAEEPAQKPVMSHDRIRRSENEVAVAFFASLKGNILHIGHNQNVAFEDVHTNIGNAYNPHQGVFVAPVSGTYVFSSSILAFNDREVWCHFTVNGIINAHIYARGTDNRHDQGSMTGIFQLKQGDDVSIQSQAADDAIYGEGYSAFSGFLLEQDFSSPVVVG